ncbi:N-acetyltransferase [Luteimicrobium album]|uniref:N-acetyltransferase n=1 Tax=Luteimicrobium album TaxID=1054550 RepID=A0ABQ6HYB9_9MICO|nr:GNAT family N-acetyltransferase [Luteimicrobium album]GMA23405.1 N-acetyltransferase [Luteimicrobium album]
MGTPATTPPPADLTTTADVRIEHLDVVFARGDPAYCWCQWDRLRGKAFDDLERSERRELTAGLLDDAHDGSAPSPGVVALAGDEPVGWCAVAPRTDLPRLFTSPSALKTLPEEQREDDGTWSVTCFAVRPGHRRQGVAGLLLDAAVEHAFGNGASAVEAYPVDVAQKPRTSSSGLYRGTLTLFLTHGFEVTARPTPGRAVVRRPAPPAT